MKQKEKKGYQYRRNIPVENYDIESEMFESNNSFNMDIMNNPDKLLGMIYEPMKHQETNRKNELNRHLSKTEKEIYYAI